MSQYQSQSKMEFAHNEPPLEHLTCLRMDAGHNSQREQASVKNEHSVVADHGSSSWAEVKGL
jgi:hypothetical protein